MKLTVENYRGIRAASIELQPGKITLLAGQNKAGKTSIIKAARAVMTGNRQPHGEVLKESGRYIYDGAERAIVTLSSEDSVRQIVWLPEDAQLLGGGPSSIGQSAAGLTNLAKLSPAERAAQLIVILRAKPTEKELIEACKQAKIEPTKEELKTASVLGWDAAEKEADTARLDAQRKWQAQTGVKTRYTTATHAKWSPLGWAPDLASTTQEQLENELSSARSDHRASIAAEAVGDAEKERLTRLAAKTPELEKVLEVTDTDITGHEQNLATAKAYLTALPPATQAENTKPCPHCQAEVVVRDGELYMPDTKKLSKQEAAARESQIQEQQAKIGTLQAELSKLQDRHRDLRAAIKEAADAATKLQQMSIASKVATKPEPEARKDVEAAENRLKAFNARLAADQLSKEIQRLEKLQGLLSADGLRKDALIEKLDAFNSELRRLCNIAGWPAVEITNAMEVQVASAERTRLYEDCSGSEQYWAAAVLQVAIAVAQGTPVVVLDEADVFDQTGRSALVKLLASAKLAALVSMMTFKPDLVPNLDGMGLGFSYWVAGGQVASMKGAVGAAK